MKNWFSALFLLHRWQSDRHYKLDCFEMWCKMKIYRQYRWLSRGKREKVVVVVDEWADGGWSAWRCMSGNYYWKNGKSFFMLIARVKSRWQWHWRESSAALRVLVPESFGETREGTARWGMGRAVVLLLLLAGFYNFLLNQRSTLCSRCYYSRTNTARSRIAAVKLAEIEERSSHLPHRPAFFIKKSLANSMFDNPSHRFFPSFFSFFAVAVAQAVMAARSDRREIWEDIITFSHFTTHRRKLKDLFWCSLGIVSNYRSWCH